MINRRHIKNRLSVTADSLILQLQLKRIKTFSRESVQFLTSHLKNRAVKSRLAFSTCKPFFSYSLKLNLKCTKRSSSVPLRKFFSILEGAADQMAPHRVDQVELKQTSLPSLRL